MDIYKKLSDSHRSESSVLDKKDLQTSALRLVLLLSCGLLLYSYWQTNEWMLVLSAIIVAGVFIRVIVMHQKMRWKNSLLKKKIELLDEEVDYHKKRKLFNTDGQEFIDHRHPYSYDLDFFGAGSLFQHLNRTSTITGKRALATSMLHILSTPEILKTQQAVNELQDMVEWRFELAALGKLNPDSEESHKELMRWAKRPISEFSSATTIFSIAIPVLFLLSFILYLVGTIPNMGNVSFILFLVNLGILGSQLKDIKEEMIPSTEIERILKHYALILEKIESHSFESSLLNDLQEKLRTNHVKASTAIHQLSRLFLQLDHVQNVFASPILNGSILFHVHTLRSIHKWRTEHSKQVEEWLEVIGNIEQLTSLANFSFNHPDYVLPALNDQQRISFTGLGHPLLPEDKSVVNDIDFNDHHFFVLTGSNMSGKSTFLRTLGVNMVLAGIGAPVYATSADINPLPVLVSMRLSDSLNDSESYFYAEVKRLKQIMDDLNQPGFVLLDEILRGTNSDDKREGTLGVIRKLATKKAIGGIATHDLEVCNVAQEYPDSIVNKRFEVEIVNDELVFDYRLREGICENKSASFIMERMNII